MAYQHSVTIGPEFFQKSKNDYNDWKWAIIREFIQNGIDAPHSSEIWISVVLEGGNTRLTVDNNGAPMSEDILVNKLLALGASGKDGINTTGGFGKAKEILYFAHLEYEITTGDLRVKGSGAGYDLERLDATWNGTTSEVLIEGDHVEELNRIAYSYIFMTQWSGEFDLNGEKLRGRFRKGSRRREFSWATVYTNKSYQDRLIVRINGIPMFYRHLSCNGKCVLLELKLGSIKTLQSNRDLLKWDYRVQLEQFIDEITVDKSSALKVRLPVYTRYEGEKLRSDKKQVEDLVAAAYATVPTQIEKEDDEEAPVAGAPIADVAVTLEEEEAPVVRQTRRRVRISHEFIVKNETGMEVPSYYLPEMFSAYSQKLVSCWVKLLLEIHEFFGKEAEFSVGFLFHEDDEAQYERSGEYGTVFYLNPATVVQQRWSQSRSLSKRWKFNNEGKHLILGAAVHEYVHSLGYHGHDESYAGKLTDTMAIVMAHKKRFHKCFR